MKVSVRAEKGCLLVNFTYQGVRCREYLNLRDTKENRRQAAFLASEIEKKIVLGTFIYGDYFQASKKALLFGEAKKDFTFEEFAKLWIERQEKRMNAGEIREASFRNYNYSLKRIVPYFEGRKMRQITKLDIKDYVTDSLKKVSAKTVCNNLIPLRQIFDDAFTEQIVATNVAKLVKNPRLKRPEIDPLGMDDVKAVLGYMRENYEEMYAFFCLLFMTGVRLSEAIAIRWKDVDFNDNVIHIRQSRTLGKINDVKTTDSNREICMVSQLSDALKNHKVKFKKLSSYVFTTQYAVAYRKQSHIITRYWKPCLNDLSIAYREMCQTRHTHAVLSLVAGDNPHDVAQRLGHTSLQMLFQKYARFIKGMQKKSKIENIF